jgi:Ca-activated chloride channel homolog
MLWAGASVFSFAGLRWRIRQMRYIPYVRAGLFLSSSLLFCMSPGFAQQPSQNPPNIRVRVERVNVGVIVTDSRGHLVEGLRHDDFHLFDDGVEQPITDFLSIDEPAQVLLLVEAGPAVYLLQEGHMQAVQILLDGLAAGDRVAIARYDQRPEAILDFIRDKRVAAGTLDQLRFNVGFGQLNLASSLTTVLDWLTRISGKKSVVLLSTGVDTSPPEAVQKLLDRLKTADVHVFAVSLSGNLQDVGNSAKKTGKRNQTVDLKTEAAAKGIAQASEELNSIAAANGSRAYFPQTGKDFAQVFAEISQLIRHEYSLGFNPPARDARIHAIEVRVAGPSENADVQPAVASAFRVDHRKAYLAPSPDSN